MQEPEVLKTEEYLGVEQHPAGMGRAAWAEGDGFVLAGAGCGQGSSGGPALGVARGVGEKEGGYMIDHGSFGEPTASSLSRLQSRCRQ